MKLLTPRSVSLASKAKEGGGGDLEAYRISVTVIF